METLIVEEIVLEEDRITLYGRNKDFHVIAHREDFKDFQIGCKITYETCGFNFGWYKKVNT